MSIAIIAHKKAANMNGGPLGALPNTFYATPLTDLLVNDGAVLNFRNGGVGAYQFDLSPGTYRISADINIVEFTTLIAGLASTSIAGLYNVSAGRFEYHLSSVTPIITCAAICGGGGGSPSDEMASTINLQGEFSVTGSVKTYEIRQAIMDALSIGNAPTDGDTLGESALVTAGGYPEYYNYVKINRLSI